MSLTLRNGKMTQEKSATAVAKFGHRVMHSYATVIEDCVAQLVKRGALRDDIDILHETPEVAVIRHRQKAMFRVKVLLTEKSAQVVSEVVQ